MLSLCLVEFSEKMSPRSEMANPSSSGPEIEAVLSKSLRVMNFPRTHPSYRGTTRDIEPRFYVQHPLAHHFSE
jgi:hypothetical protein